MNKAELVKELEKHLGSRKAANDALSAVIDVIIREVAKGGKVAITGFGTFEKSARAARTGRNPEPARRVRIRRTNVPKFRAGAGFKEVVANPKRLPKAAVAGAPCGGRHGDQGRCRRDGRCREEGGSREEGGVHGQGHGQRPHGQEGGAGQEGGHEDGRSGQEGGHQDGCEEDDGDEDGRREEDDGDEDGRREEDHDDEDRPGQEDGSGEEDRPGQEDRAGQEGDGEEDHGEAGRQEGLTCPTTEAGTRGCRPLSSADMLCPWPTSSP